MKQIEKIIINLKKKQFTWLITGVAGFIGSNLADLLLSLNQIVVGIDNFSSGSKKNLTEVKKNILTKQWKNFYFLKGDISKINFCQRIPKKIDFVLHHAATVSVPNSLKDPILTNKNNISGFLNILQISKLRKVKSFVYASSSVVYGNNFAKPITEKAMASPLSPYALTNFSNEQYA